MDFTFGIITSGKPEVVGRVEGMIASIRALNIPNYEVVIVGNIDKKLGTDVNQVHFDESYKPLWITRKKNIITETAKFENIVYCHDYVQFMPGWYEGWLQHPDFQIGMNRIQMIEGPRYRDWVLCPCGKTVAAKIACGLPGNVDHQILPYTEKRLTKLQYISGTYWLGKKAVMDKCRLPEHMTWGSGEDITWSHRVCRLCDFTINADSTVKLMQSHDPVFWEMSVENATKLGDYAAANEIPEGY